MSKKLIFRQKNLCKMNHQSQFFMLKIVWIILHFFVAYNICSAEKLTKCSSNTVLCLVSFSAEQRLSETQISKFCQFFNIMKHCYWWSQQTKTRIRFFKLMLSYTEIPEGGLLDNGVPQDDLLVILTLKLTKKPFKLP